MSVNSATSRLRRGIGDLLTAVIEPAWVLLCFFAVAILVLGTVVEAVPALDTVFETTIGQLLSGGLIYVLALFAVLLPVWLKRGRRYLITLLGLQNRPTTTTWWLPFILWGVYMVATIAAAILAQQFLPWIDQQQPQEVGFDNLTLPVEYVLAFVALVILPPIAEELLFRGYLFGRLRERFGFWFTTAVVSVTFGFVHFQWNVGIDTAVLSVFLCYLRERTGTIWASMVLHAIKNGLAYFLLFIAPLIGISVGS
jgi:membrane protease YdiL (CAAX protease family)